MKRLRLLVVCAGLLAWGAALAAVTASLDRDQVAAGESVTLTLARDGSGGGQPDLGPLARDFDVLGRSSSSSVQIINGSMSAQRQLQITLAPRRSGHLTIPALNWDGESSPQLALEVGSSSGGGNAGGASASAAAAAPVFISTTLEPARPYVQAATVLTVKLYADQPLYQASLALPGNGDVRVQQLGQDQQSSETRDGHSYRVVQRRYLLFPQRSGSLRLDGPVLDAQVAERNAFDPAFGTLRLPGIFGATRPLRLHGDAIVLDVRPRPASLGANAWLPAQQLTLTGTWKPAGGPVHVGDPLTLHLSLSAVGVGAAQLPDLGALLVPPDGVKAYPDQAKLDSTEQAGNLVGQRDQDIALIADRPGTFTLPEIRLAWWDTVQDKAREVVLPAHRFEVLPAAGVPLATGPAPALPASAAPAAQAPSPAVAAAAPLPSPATAARPDPWPWVSLALALLWLGTALGWWWSRRDPKEKTPQAPARPQRRRPADALRRVHEACRANRPRDARSALLAWAALEWPDAAPAGLQALANRCGDAALAEGLRELDRACFAGGSWNGSTLSQGLDAMPARAGATREADLLGPLYA